MIKIKNTPFNQEKMASLLTKETELIVDYLVSRYNEKVTLRDIKRAFPNIESMDRLIDELVSFDLLTRSKRTYSFAGNIVTKDVQDEVIDKVTQYLSKKESEIFSVMNDELAKIDFNNRQLVVLYQLFSDGVFEKDSIYPETEFSKRCLSLPTRYTEVSGKKDRFFTMATREPFYAHNLSDYFNFLSLNRDDLPEEFLKTRRKIGDVNSLYFMNYCERKLRRLEKGKVISTIKPDIFMEVLYNMKYCLVEDEQYSFNIVRIKDTCLSSLTKIQEQLVNEINLVNFDEEEKKFMVNVLFFQWLVSQNLIDPTQTCHGVL
ncbi:MAG: DUF1803 domain-containing protein [Vagococcus sp.]|uniref:DUF1803 domain-containing protein n=1 Tax=Vagococcus sp. TaxID=1933889 RepID=UPI002FC9840C